MLQADEPADYVVATGDSASVKDFAEAAFSVVGKDWREFTKTDQRYERPAEVPDLIGDAGKAKRVLGWEPTVRWQELARIMVEADLEAAEREARVRNA